MDYRKGNLLNQVGIGIIVHGCNAQGVMGAGFAKQLATKYPEAFLAYKNGLQIEKENPLGKVYYHTVFHCEDRQFVIANAITQATTRTYVGQKCTSYDAVDQAMEKIFGDFSIENSYRDFGPNFQIHMPKIGAGLGGGNWEVIETIIRVRATEFNMLDKINIWTLE